MAAAFKPEDWLQSADALKRMARAIVEDEHLSEDLVQSAYLAALERPPERLSRAWLARVLRNRAFDVLRRRRDRDEPERLESDSPRGDEIAERLELHQVLSEAVAQLEEPYRRAVYLRYFEGLGPSAIARELGLPTKTVKTRLHRALASLRERLERRLGGGSGDWRACALAMSGAPSAAGALSSAHSVSQGGLAIMAKKIVSAAALALVAWGVIEWLPFESTRLDPEASVAAELRAPEAPERALEPALATPEVEVERTAAAPDPAPRPVAGAARTGSLDVYVTWPGGEQASGIAIDVRTMARGLPNAGLARVVSDDAGLARAENLPVTSVHVSSDRGAGEPGIDVDVVAGEVRDVHFELPAGVEVEGLVVDESGAPVAHADVWLTTGHTDWQGGSVVATADAAGVFHLFHVPASQSLGALAAGHAPSALVDLDTLDTALTPVKVQLQLAEAGGGLRGRVFDPAGAPVPGAWVSAGKPVAYFPNRDRGAGEVETWTPRSVRCDDEGRFRIDGLGLGAVPLAAHAEPYSIWNGTATVVAGAPARELEIHLRHGFTVEGIVRDRAGMPVAGAVLRGFARELDESFLQSGQFDYVSTFGYPTARSDEAGHYRLVALPSGAAYLYASSAPRRRTHVYHRPEIHAETVVAGSNGDIATWDPILEEGPTIAGVVTFRDGAPMVGAYVSARNDRTGKAQSLSTDGDGRFLFVNMERAPHTLGVQLWTAPKDAEPLEATGVLPDGDEVRLVASFDSQQDVELGVVLGRVEDSAGRFARPATMSVELLSDRRFGRYGETLDGGRFRFEGVSPGRYQLIVFWGEVEVLAGTWFELASGAERDLGTLATAPCSAVRFRLHRVPRTEAVESVAYIRHPGASRVREVEIGRESEVLVEDLSVGEYTITCYGDGMASIDASFTVSVGVTADVSVDFIPAVARRIEVWWPAGQALGKLALHVEDDRGIPQWDVAQENVAFLDRPYVRTIPLALGRYTVTASTLTGMTGSALFEVESLDGEQPVVRVEMR